jgi:outer membrane cobalamin receptor
VNTPRRSPVRYLSRIVSVSILTLTALFAGARSTDAGPLTGRVLDPDGRPVTAARVLLLGTSGSVGSTTTNASGEFTLTAPDTGRYELRIAYEGFRAEPMVVEGSSSARDLGTLALAVSALSETLVVSASQVEIPLSRASAAVSIITGGELRDRQVSTVADALRQVPGMTVARAGSAGALTSVFPRGGESDYTLVYIDGIQVNAFGGGFDFAHLSTANIERIEVVRGPQSALYGSNAIGGVVRIVTRESGPVRGDASLEGGSFGSTRMTLSSSGSSGGWSWGAGVDRLASNGFNDQQTASGEEIVNDDYERTEVAGSGGWRDDSGRTLRAELRFARDERGFPGPFGSNPIGVFTGIDQVSRGSDDRWSASLGGTIPSGRRVRTHGQLTWNAIDGDYASQFGASQSGSRRVTARGQTDISAGHGLDLSAGLEFLRERGTSSYITDNTGEIPIERWVAGYFGEARWKLAERLFVTGGVRLDDIHRDAVGALDSPDSPRPMMPADDVVSVNPKISAAYYLRQAPGTQTKVRASAGSGIRPPDAFELAFTDNPSLQPERSRSLEAGIDQSFASGRGLLEATWFQNTFDDLIVAVGRFVGSSRYRTDNISNARADGLELASTLRARTAGFDLHGRLTYTFLDSEILEGDGAGAAPSPFTAGQPLLNRPRHQWAIDASAARGRASAWVRGGGRGRVLAVEPSYGTFGGLFDANGYNVWNAGASWRVSRRFEVFGRVENLFDRQYEEVFGFPALGRGAMAGLRIAASR